MDLISFRAFARLDGCSESLVRRGVKKGWLTPGADGRLDAALAGTTWREGNAKRASAHMRTPGAHSASSARRAGEPIEDAAARLADAARVIPAYAESVARKEHFLALLRELEYDEKVKTVVLASAVAEVVGEQLATVRTKLLAIPSSHAPRIARLKTATEVQDAVLEVIVDALSELTSDAPTERTS